MTPFEEEPNLAACNSCSTVTVLTPQHSVWIGEKGGRINGKMIVTIS